MDMIENDKCPRCGHQRSANAQTGPCRSCLLNYALTSTDPASPGDDDIIVDDSNIIDNNQGHLTQVSSAPKRIGDYDIIDELGRGGMGVIYRARQRASGRVVALKVIQSEDMATGEAYQRFLAEIKAAQRLEHSHIVAVDDVGEYAGRLYYTMKLYPRVLARELTRFRDPERAAALVATIADAVDHGHRRGVLHRDLKPANILLDEDGRPHVSDYGTAKCLGEPRLTATGAVVGTPMYMAPEQAAGRNQDVTTAADVYSLGMILYELLIGTLPFGDVSDKSDESILYMLRNDSWMPVFPRALAKVVPSKLKTICLKCLERDPRARYSAEGLSRDLNHFLRGEPIEAEAVGARLWRFTRHHPLPVVAGTGIALLLGSVAAAATVVAHTQEEELRQKELEANRASASSQANSVLLYLRDLIDPLTANLTGERIVKLLPRAEEQHSSCPESNDGPLQHQPADDDLAVLGRLVNDEYLRQHPSLANSATAEDLRAYDQLALFDRCGKVIGFTGDRSKLQRHYGWRAYLKDLKDLIEGGKEGLLKACISRAFRAEYDGHYKFPIAVPIYDGKHQWVGMVMASISSQSAWDRTSMPGRHDRDHVEILVASHDYERNSPSGASFVVVRHDPEANLDDIDLDPSVLRAFGVDDDFRDPVPGFEGRWLAGWAPVGDTSFFEIVATRYDAAIAPNTRLSLRLVWLVSAVLLASSMTLAATLWGCAAWRRRASRKKQLPKATLSNPPGQAARP